MLDNDTGEALSTADARAYADEYVVTFINDQELVAAIQ
jgi:hypothetical protein